MTELNNSQGYRVNCPLALLIVQVYVFCIIIMYMILILYIIYYSYNIYNIHTSYCAVLHKLPMYPTYYVLNTYVRFMFYVCHLIMRPKLSRLVSMASILRLRVFECTACESSFSTIVSVRIKCITQGRSPVRFDEPFFNANSFPKLYVFR